MLDLHVHVCVGVHVLVHVTRKYMWPILVCCTICTALLSIHTCTHMLRVYIPSDLFVVVKVLIIVFCLTHRDKDNDSVILPPGDAQHNDPHHSKVTVDTHNKPATAEPHVTGQGDATPTGQGQLVQHGEAGQAGAVVKAQITRQGSPTSSRSVSFLCDETSDVTSQGTTAERQANTY